MDWSSELDFALRICVAVILGGLVGFEREIKGKPAGLRTHMLVAGGSALVLDLGFRLIDVVYSLEYPNIVRADPTRIIQSIIIGISFIGAGTIIQREHKERVDNLTTAASILYTSGIGIAAGIGFYMSALIATLVILIVNSLFGWLEQVFRIKKSEHLDD